MKLLLHAVPAPLLLFLLGAAGYPLIELLWRGRTHWTMALAGGVSMLLLLMISRTSLPLPITWLAGALAITGVEFAVGYVVNLRLGWAVWDYSTIPLNLMGQICLPFSAAWFGLSIPAIAFCRMLDGMLD